MIRVLFPNLLAPKLDIRRTQGDGTCCSALEHLVADLNTYSAQAYSPSRLKFHEIRALRQLDNDEPTLTYYLFSALGSRPGISGMRPGSAT